ncbi:bifunctional RNase H/acid phosphatase [Streptomyces sporangiiformans]|uniref:Bifunctional RNase H/acid phosphatase n=1 Tax=Streptomyces sporangiiformans TaxID=2315329 RepID=A0A505DEE4_9ACTN|nr:bifunctional RNase H/acid phosphatase [Streptomyces sporangiiformans]TPQ18948.1 bifunctional RNase H/acid phosphatase [Streptomyces sporangiiformans]
MREFIVEADGGSRGNPGPAGYGAVVIDAATGQPLAEVAEYIGIATNNVAEYRGLLAGLRAARELDPSASVRVRMDSKLVVEQMSGRWQVKHPGIRPLAAEASRVFPPDRVTYEWIPRAQNKHADRLANEAMDAGKRGEQWSASRSSAEPAASAEASAESAESAESVAKADADVRAARNVAAVAAAPDLGVPATLVLLRHGETPLTPQKRFSGSGGSDPGLSEAGRTQAERVAGALMARGTVQDIVSSPLARCRETAGIIAARLGLDVRVEDGLRETDFGAWEGLTFGEVRERYAEDLTAWLGSAEAEPTGGGESFEAVARRVATARDTLIATHTGRTVLVVSHVTPIKTLVRLALGAPPESLFRMELSAASLSVIAYYADGNASLRLLNDTSHLR